MKGEFVARVMRIWPHLKDDVSYHAFVSDIEEKEAEGWDIKDVIAYVRTFEEVNPTPEDADAEYMLRLEASELERRARIEAKYLGRNVELHVVRFEALAPMVSR